MSVATITALTVDCRSCGKPVSTRAKPGNTIRCPSCGYAQRLRPPGQVAQLRPPGQPAQLRQAAPAGSWDPPSQPRQPYHTADPCPECGKPLRAEPRGTIRWCQPCWVRVTPPGVLAPYERDGHAVATRQVRSQREHDADGKALEARRQQIAEAIDAIAADKRLTPGARGILKWYRTAVDKATTMARLDDLVEQMRGERLQRTGWFTRDAVAEIEPPRGDDDWEGDEDDDDDEWAVVRPSAMTWAGAIASLGWRLDPDQRGCQLIADGRPCNGPADRDLGKAAWACSHHYVLLGNVIKRDRRERAVS